MDTRKCWTCYRAVPLRRPIDPTKPRLARHGDDNGECPAGGKPLDAKHVLVLPPDLKKAA